MKTSKRKNIMKPAFPMESESGSAIVVALLVLVMLTIFGMTSLTTTDSELQVVRGEKNYLQDFFAAESAWKEGAKWLSDKGVPPEYVNTNAEAEYVDYVKNFGGFEEDNYNTGLDDDTEDGTVDDGTADGVPYWYNIERIVAKTVTEVPGESSDRVLFWYESTANADRSQQIRVELSKLYKIGN